jgi:surface antigen
MKILDPTSVVREGEFATAANAGSVGDKLINQYNKIINGERLTDAQRNDFVARAKGLYQSAINQQKQIDKTFSDRADKFGIPADYVIRSQNSFNDSPINYQYSSLKEYKNSVSPEQFNKISSIIQQENLDETDALKLINKLGFNLPLSMGQNGSIAPKIAQKYPEGAKGGQCTTFLHSLVQFPPIGDGKTQKFASVDKFGITADQLRQNPQIGDVIVTGENKTYGHTAMINAILPNGFRVTESNFRGDERVTHDRIIPFNSPQIYGAIRGPLKL